MEEIIKAIGEQNLLLRKILEALNKNDHESRREYLTVKETAKVLNRTPKTIRNWIASGKIKAIKMHKGQKQDHYYISKESVSKLLTKRCF